MLMLKFLLIIFSFFFVFEKSYSENQNCNFLIQKKETPCIEITKTANTSFFSKNNINKIIVSKKEIEESGAVDLIDVLNSIPDINITQSGPKGQQASIFMRGTGSNHTLVMINGIPINDQSTTQGLHDFGVDFIQTIQQIEIYPGSNGTHFGSNAIGGAINIVLNSDYKDTFSITTDNNANYELSGSKTFFQEETLLNVKIGVVSNETISAKGKLNDEKDGLKNYTTNINYEKFFSENTKFYNTIYLRQTKAEYDNSINNQTGYQGDNKMGSFQFGLKNQNDSKKDNYIFYYNVYDREYDERGTLDTYESEAIGIKYDIDANHNDKFSFGGGSEYIYNWGYFDNKGSYQASTKGNSHNLALYGNLGWNILENSTISLFARNDSHKQTGSNITYKLNFENYIENIKLGFSYMSSLRNPTLYELFGTDNFGYSGNKNLKPEKSNTYEVYTEINLNNNFDFSLRGFQSNIKDNIEYINNQYKNDVDNVDLNQSGINGELIFKSDNTNINFFSSFLSSKKENGSSQLRRPEKNYGINLNKNIDILSMRDLNLNILYNHYGKHFDTHSVNFSTIEMDSTDIIDLKLNKKFNKVDFFLKISNLFDEKYQRPHGYNQEERLIKIGFKY